MSHYRKPKNIVLRMALIFILVGLFIWSYFLFSQNYERVELSQRMVDALLENKTELARSYAQELGLVQENLDQTQAFLNDIKMENMKLKEKIKLLDDLNAMEREIAQLKEENARINEMMKAVQEEDQVGQGGFQFETIEKGRSLLQKFKDKIRGVRERIGCLRRKEYKKKEAVQQEIDYRESLLGNNGYLVKDGKSMPMTIPDVQKLPDDIRVNVKFVK